jgi:hypothetical protein
VTSAALKLLNVGVRPSRSKRCEVRSDRGGGMSTDGVGMQVQALQHRERRNMGPS